MKKGKRMNLGVRRIIENRKERQIVESKRVIEKEEITSAEFLESRNTIYTKITPSIPMGVYLLYRESSVKLISSFGQTHRDKSRLPKAVFKTS